MLCMMSLSAAAAIPNVRLNNGVQLPMISLGTWQYTPAVAQATVTLGLSLGFNHIDTANDYGNQEAVGAALAKHNRSSYFITTKVPSTPKSTYDTTTTDLNGDLVALGLKYVDLMLIHFPPQVGKNAPLCTVMQEQWRAMEDFYAAGKARAIGVSNYCPSSLRCIEQVWNVTPAVNQVEYHVGMSADPGGIKSYCTTKGIVLQAYSPLGDGTTELINGPLVSGIGAAHNKTGAQVSLHWVIKQGVPVSTKSTNPTHLAGDLDIFDWDVTDAELATLNTATTPAGHYSFKCTA